MTCADIMTLVSVSEELMKTVIEQHSGRAMRAICPASRELLTHRPLFRTAEEVR